MLWCHMTHYLKVKGEGISGPSGHLTLFNITKNAYYISAA
uniref:Uncharacterized protein n=1 Tax=Anguilla anguilla TaxID=7936 RepID=A0A0E9SCK1_ANGAN